MGDTFSPPSPPPAPNFGPGLAYQSPPPDPALAAAADAAKKADITAIQTDLQGQSASLLRRYGQQQSLTATVGTDATSAAAATPAAAPADGGNLDSLDLLKNNIPFPLALLMFGAGAGGGGSPLLQQQLKFG